MATTHLSVIFNHRFDSNLDRLDSIYGSRFRDIRYLMPFYSGNRSDVISIHEASSQFQGYFAQAYRELAKINADFYAFAGDDLLLHPKLTDENLASELGLVSPGLPDAAYTKQFNAVEEQPVTWAYTLPSLRAFRPIPWVNYTSELPDYEKAMGRLKLHKIESKPMSRRRALTTAWKAHFTSDRIQMLHFAYRHLDHRPYPLVAGYSDFIVVPAHALREFCRLCGVFAAIRVWVEVAVPTALVYSCDRIVTEADTHWRGKEYWGAIEVERGITPRYASGTPNLKELFASYTDDELYIHPVKLSRFAAPSPPLEALPHPA